MLSTRALLSKSLLMIKQTLNKVEQSNAIYLPSTVIGELYYGAYNSNRVTKNIKQIEELIESTPILDSNIVTAKEYGIIKKDLKIKGTPIPENDIWISAIAIQFDLKLAGRDDHFKYIDSLNYEEW